MAEYTYWLEDASNADEEYTVQYTAHADEVWESRHSARIVPEIEIQAVTNWYGQPMPEEWIKEHADRICSEIEAELTEGDEY